MKDNSRLVYSTETGRIRPDRQAVDSAVAANQKPSDGCIRLARESKGRGGKQVTLVHGIEPDKQMDVAKKLKAACACGGSLKGDTIEIQGDHRPKIQQQLEKMGYRVKISGG
jgi:translation initiation factor 1